MLKLLAKLKKPCKKCPYKLGLIHTTTNPCPQCKLDNYSAYERFQKMPYEHKVEHKDS